MHLRSLLSGTLALIFLAGTAAFASTRSDGPAPEPPGIGLPGAFGSSSARDESPLRLAQASDPRITALEEQLRVLNGTVEELNFQILQMQEQLRKMQEDNEFRFQELEKRSGVTSPAPSPDVAGAGEPASPPGGAAPQPPADGVGEIIAGSEPVAPQTGELPKSLGTLSVDPDGNITSGGQESPPPGDDSVAALPSTSGPEELYRNSYEFILSGDYAAAESGFRSHIEQFPQDARTADARFWLGESLLGQQRYRDAAEVFLAASQDYPDSRKGPDILLKLGISLAGLNQREVACATFGEIPKRYPQVSGALRERIKQEQALAAC